VSRNASEVADAELIKLAAGGDGDAFEELMVRYYDKVYAVLARMVHDAERARDLTQECFLKVWRALPSFAGESSFYTWVYQISRNLVISELRRERARPRVSASIDQGEGSGGDAPVAVADERGDPVRAASRRERQRVLVDAVASLAPDFREIIVLRDIERLAYEEIAVMLSIPVGTVRSRLHRARCELKAKISGVLD
jgi:RNA polymerase sigma-70 factor, ECF subfamily